MARPDWGDDVGLEEPESVELNLTALIDVMMVLLIVFLVSASVVVETTRADSAQGVIELALPTGQMPSTAQVPSEIAVQIDTDGALFENGKATDWRTLAQSLATRLAKDPELQVRVDSDQRLPVQRLVELIADLQALGVRNVGLGTKAQAK
jgi:biopolymer transport protein ExbD